MTSTIVTERNGPLTRIRLDRPEQLNAFSPQLVDALLAAVNEASGDGTRLAVFSGNGRAFSSGFDLKGLDTVSDGDMLLRFVRVEQVLQAVYHAPFATLALAHGPCFGAAADLVSVCRRRVAAPDAWFRMPGPLFGVVLGTRRLTNLCGADTARALAQRARPFDVAQALGARFVHEMREPDEWESVIEEALDEALRLDPVTYCAIVGRTLDDSRAADMAALVNSVSTGSITARLTDYVAQVNRARSDEAKR